MFIVKEECIIRKHDNILSNDLKYIVSDSIKIWVLREN